MYSEVNVLGLNLCWVVKCKCQRPQHKCRRSKALLHLENVSKKLVYKSLFVLDVSMRGCRHLPVSKCSALPSAAVFFKERTLGLQLWRDTLSYLSVQWPRLECRIQYNTQERWEAVVSRPGGLQGADKAFGIHELPSHHPWYRSACSINPR